jgi:hypothetical protein
MDKHFLVYDDSNYDNTKDLQNHNNNNNNPTVTAFSKEIIPIIENKPLSYLAWALNSLVY